MFKLNSWFFNSEIDIDKKKKPLIGVLIKKAF